MTFFRATLSNIVAGFVVAVVLALAPAVLHVLGWFPGDGAFVLRWSQMIRAFLSEPVTAPRYLAYAPVVLVGVLLGRIIGPRIRLQWDLWRNKPENAQERLGRLSHLHSLFENQVRNQTLASLESDYPDNPTIEQKKAIILLAIADDHPLTLKEVRELLSLTAVMGRHSIQGLIDLKLVSMQQAGGEWYVRLSPKGVKYAVDNRLAC